MHRSILIYFFINDNEAFKRLNEGFQCVNNWGLCGFEFSTLRICAAFDNGAVNANVKDEGKETEMGLVGGD